MLAAYSIKFPNKLFLSAVLFTLLGWSLVGCSVASEISMRLFPQPSGTALFFDDFSIINQNWSQTDGFEFAAGGYMISVDNDHRMIWSGPMEKFGLVHLEVDARKYSGGEDNSYGIVCGAVDQDNYFFLIISSDGYYGIGEVRQDRSRLIGMEAMQPSEAILRGDNWNHLSADCLATRLSLYVNGTQIGDITGIRYRPGRIGLVAGTIESATSQILFDNFKVKAP